MPPLPPIPAHRASATTPLRPAPPPGSVFFALLLGAIDMENATSRAEVDAVVTKARYINSMDPATRMTVDCNVSPSGMTVCVMVRIDGVFGSHPGPAQIYMPTGNERILLRHVEVQSITMMSFDECVCNLFLLFCGVAVVYKAVSGACARY